MVSAILETLPFSLLDQCPELSGTLIVV